MPFPPSSFLIIFTTTTTDNNNNNNNTDDNTAQQQGWRRTLTSYRRCEDQDVDSPQAKHGPTVLFNQVSRGVVWT
jgi:hypothetical protein